MVLTLFGVAAFVTLGFWQLDRAAREGALVRRIRRCRRAGAGDARSSAPARNAAALSAASACAAATTRMHAMCSSTRRTTARSAASRFAIFEPADGSTPLLVDRGFVARDGARRRGRRSRRRRKASSSCRRCMRRRRDRACTSAAIALPRQKAWPKQSIYLDVGEIGGDAGRRLDRENPAARAGAGQRLRARVASECVSARTPSRVRVHLVHAGCRRRRSSSSACTGAKTHRHDIPKIASAPV